MCHRKQSISRAPRGVPPVEALPRSLMRMSQDQLGRAEIIANLQDFATGWAERIVQWRAEGETATERRYAQQFWSALLRCFGIIPERINLFEQDATRASTGRRGWIDFFMAGVAIGEAKSLGVNLDDAVEQINDYLRGGIGQTEWPKYAIATNFEQLRVLRLDGTEPEVRFTIGELPQHYDTLKFLIGLETVTHREQEEASIVAARLMAGLYTSVLGEDADQTVGEQAPRTREEEDDRAERTSILMTRLLFMLYGDDAGLWRRDLFYQWVLEHTDADSLSTQLEALFRHLNTPPARRSPRTPELMAQFPYVNGGIFADATEVDWFTPETREALLAACRFQWSRISVSVFGAMFQLVKSKEARRAAGEHYTSEENILKTIGPLFLDDYRARADRLIRNKSTSTREFDGFLEEMAANIYVDPACGGGNFLNVAYARLREIETDVLAEKRRRSKDYSATQGMTMSLDATLDQKLTIDRFYGIEINWWPAKIAETAMFLVDHQANLRLAAAIGQAPERLPITITAHITHGNALRLDWEEILPEPAGQTFIFGNPPFLGDNTRDAAQLADMRHAWGNIDQLSRLDFVTSWHAKALQLYRDRRGAFAFVTTNSITQGDQVPRLFGLIFGQGWRVAFAHRTFAWDSQAPGQAAVHCVIVGFDRDRATRARLFDYETPRAEAREVPVSQGINAYLVDGPNLLVEKRSKVLSPALNKTAYGSKPTDGGHLIVEPADYAEFMADPVAAKYVHPYVGASELLHDKDRWCLWLEGMNPEDLRRSALLKARVEAVRAFREKSSAASTREYPHHHLFRQLAKRDEPYVCIPRHVSETRRYFTVKRFGPEVIAGDANFTISDPDGLQFAALSSSMFLAWQKAIGGRLESRLRFGSTLTWYTFPFPDVDDTTRAKITAAGQKVLDARALHPDRSLAAHYAPLAMDPALVRAHDALDREVDKAFGAPRKLTTEEQRQEVLFKAYAAMLRQ